MTLEDKVEKLCDMHNISSQQELAKILELNYVVMNRNIKANKLTIDFILALVKRFPKVDLNFWVKDVLDEVAESNSFYGIKDSITLIDELEMRLHDLRTILTQK